MQKFVTIFFTAFASLVRAQSVYAGLLQDSAKNDIDQRVTELGDEAGFLTSSISFGDLVGEIIKAFLGLLAVIFVCLMVYAGYKWMTAAGEEQKVTTAKDTIKRAIIGLVITIGAYSITYYVFQHLPGGG